MLLDNDIRNLSTQKKDWENITHQMQDILAAYPENKRRATEQLENLRTDGQTAQSFLSPQTAFSRPGTPNSPEFTRKFALVKNGAVDYRDISAEEFGAILEKFKESGKSEQYIGNYAGFRVTLEYAKDTKKLSAVVTGREDYRINLTQSAPHNLRKFEALPSLIAERFEAAQARVSRLDWEKSEAELRADKPFPLEDELQRKKAESEAETSEIHKQEKEPEKSTNLVDFSKIDTHTLDGFAVKGTREKDIDPPPPEREKRRFD